VFEYSALGVPVVAYPLRETQRLMGEAGEFATSDRPEDLAKAIGRLLADDALRAQRATEVATLAGEKFSWDREAAAYVAAFDRLLPAG
jgi:glycosyltransferase involved in cell wall biosynthesis